MALTLPPAPRKALVADDSATARASLGTFLGQYAFETEYAEDGLSALRLLLQKTFDLAFLDLEMPGLGGSELLRILRHRGHQIPVVLTTATKDMRLLVATIKMGASDYISKPFDADSVGAALGRVYGTEPGLIAGRG